MSHPAMWQDSPWTLLAQAFTEWHAWLVVGWLVFSLLVIAVVGDGDS